MHRCSPFGPLLRVHANELADYQNLQQAHTVIHANYLSDLYVDTDNSTDFGLLDTWDVDLYLNQMYKLTEQDTMHACCDVVYNNSQLPNLYSNDHQPIDDKQNIATIQQQQTDSLSWQNDLSEQKPYPYTAHVVALQACIPSAPCTKLPASAERIVTPLKLQNWLSAMKEYPDAQFANYIETGIKHGFRIGFQYGSVRCISTKANAKSASLHPRPITTYLNEELKECRIAGPFPMALLPEVQCNKLGVIQKSTPGEWRLILDPILPKTTQCQ